MSLQPPVDALLPVLDGTDPTHIVHVAGGDGSILAAILERLPHATGALVDRSEVVAAAGPVLEASRVADRVDVVDVGPDAPIPAGGDVYLIVDRDGPLPAALLGRCRAAMSAAARLIACSPPEADRAAALSELVEGAGFAIDRVEPSGETEHGWWVVVARPRAADE
jgi:hypothetical protein